MSLLKLRIAQIILGLSLFIFTSIYIREQMIHPMKMVHRQIIREPPPRQADPLQIKATTHSQVLNMTISSKENDNFERAQRLHQICQGNKDRYRGKGNVNFNVHIDAKHSIVFCQIQKSGSTFWKQVIEYTMHKDKKHYKSPFLIQYGDMRIPHLPYTKMSGARKKAFDESFKFLFVREPYGRLFAGYVDKFFSPNAFYWHLIGKYIQNLTRPYENRTVCAHDVTFKEFIKYVIQSEKDFKNRDRHFSPQYGHCKPCDIKYSFVGKMETFKTDAMYVLDIINNRSNNAITFSEHFKEESDIESIKEKTRYWFSDMSTLAKCTPKSEVFLRMWRNFQIRGILSKKAYFPVSKYEFYRVTGKMFERLALKAYNRFKDNKERKKNKMEALLEAYSQIDREDMMKLKEIVRPDCDLFGYDSEPDYLFRIDKKSLPKFKYLDVGY